MKPRTVTYIFVVCGILVAAVEAADQKSPAANESDLTQRGFVRLFNGTDLDGWEGQPGAWEVQDGAIYCTGKQPSRNWLIWRGGELEDFELRLKFLFIKGNSGVQVRSKEIEPFMVRGYQVEVAPQDKMGLWHHSISPSKHRSHLATAGQKVQIAPNGDRTVEQFASPEEVQAAFREDDWNELIVVGKGARLIQKINGIIFADLIDEETTYSLRSGLLAFQDHGKGTIVAFKDIWLKRPATSTRATP
ncbi:MAG: DUF1080 domain-containing protein [Pirellulaceae bacterium]